ncbi:hypothetical protein [Halorhabdus rudnickae]|nr:hypothetical protein [Halorhabdus rudnickae]
MSKNTALETFTCPECDEEIKSDPIHEGEIQRSTICPNCGNWVTVYEAK